MAALGRTGGGNVGDELHARDFGLTFLIRRDVLDELFPLENDAQPGAEPILRLGQFKVWKRVGEKCKHGAVRLFRHPDDSFEVRQPRLAGARIELVRNSIALIWDLEPAWGRSGAQHAENGKIELDPEADLRYYRIERRFEGLKSPWISTFEVKAAAPMSIENIGSELVITQIKPTQQHVDDLSEGGVPDDLRSLLLSLPIESGRTAEAVWKEYVRSDGTEDSISIVYTITPIDIMGTAADADVIEYVIERPSSRVAAPVPWSSRSAIGSCQVWATPVTPRLRFRWCWRKIRRYR